MKSVYLDNAAATPIDPVVLEAMRPYLETQFVNPSSVYRQARSTRKALADARASIADELGAKPTEIIFTSGTTESDNLAIAGTLRAVHQSRPVGSEKMQQPHWVTGAIEHEAVLAQVGPLEREGFASTVVPPEADGTMDATRLLAAVTDATALISLMLANNEIGTIQPLREVAAGIRRIRADRASRGIACPLVLHCDGAQAPCYLPLKVETLGVDLLSLGGGKMYGPRGAGLLYVRSGTPLVPIIYGGGQERGRRSGTENVAGAVGLAVALSVAAGLRHSESARLAVLRDQLIDGVLAAVPGVRLNGSRRNRLVSNANFTFDGIAGEDLVLYLDNAGIMASTGSACATGSLEPSHVLTAIGRSKAEAESSLRLSLGRSTDRTDTDRVLEVLPSIVSRLRANG